MGGTQEGSLVKGLAHELEAHGQAVSGEAARDWRWSLGEDYPGVLLAILPPGAFIGLGFMIALKNIIDKRLQRREKTPAAAAEPLSV